MYLIYLWIIPICFLTDAISEHRDSPAPLILMELWSLLASPMLLLSGKTCLSGLTKLLQTFGNDISTAGNATNHKNGWLKHSPCKG